MEVRELLSKYEVPGDAIPIIKGSAKMRWKATRASWASSRSSSWPRRCDSYIPTPERAIDQPFLMPIEDVFSISGRGTVSRGGWSAAWSGWARRSRSSAFGRR